MCLSEEHKVDILFEYGLVAVFLGLILTPFGLPLPEEISILVAGGLTANGHANMVTAWIVCFIGVTFGDVISWTMGRTVGLEPKGFVGRLIGKEQIDEIEDFFDRWGAWAIVIARQLPGMRFPAFFFAGASRVPLPKFYFIDGLSALVTVNVFFYIGYKFAGTLEQVKPYIDNFRQTASLLATIAIGLFIARIVWKRLKKK